MDMKKLVGIALILTGAEMLLGWSIIGLIIIVMGVVIILHSGEI